MEYIYNKKILLNSSRYTNQSQLCNISYNLNQIFCYDVEDEKLIKIIITSFWIIFLAELGDKTQFQTMILASQTRNPIAVFIGASSALVVSVIIGIIFSNFIIRYIPEEVIRMASGFLFIAIGILTLLNKI